jgi:23S rRNA (cytidine1920-2'-O)/16S rRNA (cytidine1409-2'-O)-methyltransferase
VIAVDVGRGQLDWGLRNDPRVHPVEGINARHLRPEDLPLAPEVALVDVSFISLRLVLPAIGECLPHGAEIVMLVKPQFEVGRRAVGKGGIVREAASHREAVARIAAFAVDIGWQVVAVVPSPVAGTKGNLEFFLHVARRADGPPGDGSWPDLVERAVEEAHRQGAEP